MKNIRQKHHPIINIYPEVNPNVAQPGDLVLSTVIDIHHPVMHYQSIKPTCPALGVARLCTYVKWVTSNGTSDWVGYENSHERLGIE